MPTRALLLALALAVSVMSPAEARAADEARVIAGAGEQRTPPDYGVPPPGWRSSAREVIALADEQPAVRRVRAAHPRTYSRAYLKARRHWQVTYFASPTGSDGRARQVAQVLIRDVDSRVIETWTGLRVDWPMARGYPGAFGQAVNRPWIWLGLCTAFLLPFLRPPLRLLHLDLAVLLSLSISYAFFTAGRIEASVPLAVPPLVYLLVRMLVVARERARWRGAGAGAGPRGDLPLTLSDGGLALGIVALLAFRMALNAINSTVIDVGYAGVIGADRLLSGDGLYGTFPLDNAHGDTYGPVNYYAYVPWELLAPWSGTWDDLPAAHAAAAVFDVAAGAACWALGRQLGGRRLGLLLAYLWLSFPFTLLTLNTNANDALTSALVGVVLLSLGRPWSRGAALAFAGLGKFAPLALAPLIATHPRGAGIGLSTQGAWHHRDWRAIAQTTVAFTVSAVVLLAPVLALDGPAVVVERTLGFQAGRSSPFSPWGLYGLEAGQLVVGGAAVALALGVSVLPRRRDAASACALAAAVLIAVQLALGHWFYTYVVWFLPALWVALLAPRATGSAQAAAGRRTDSIESARRGRPARMSTALSHGSSSDGS